jgi:hypothetical protein
MERSAHLQTISDEPWENLIRAIILQAVKDYKLAYKRERKRKNNLNPSMGIVNTQSIERFFTSQWFYELTQMDGEVLITRIKENIDAISTKAMDTRFKLEQ